METRIMVAGRQQGKTNAAINALLQHPENVLICSNATEKQRLEQKYPGVRGRVFHRNGLLSIRGRSVNHIIVDEGDPNRTHIMGYPISFMTVTEEEKPFIEDIADEDF